MKLRQAAAAILLAPALPALAAGAANAPGAPSVAIETYSLDNGMKVILSEDHAFPVIGYAITYGVGSRAEAPGRSGFAHLFEHMMFQGTPTVGKGEFFKYIENNGGVLNGSTHVDYTNYYAELPSHRLEMALWLESDRMRSLAITADNLKNQQEAVKEEKRLGIDNQPYAGALVTDLSEAAFRNRANSHSTIGSFDDLNAATVDDVASFFRTYYAPNNATLVVAGDFDPAEAKKLVAKYFGDIPKQPRPEAIDTTEPASTAEIRKVVKDPLAPAPAVVVTWRGPERGTRDYYALAILERVLYKGTSSRLYQGLVKGKEVVVQLQGDMGIPNGDYTDYRSPGLMGLFAIYKPSIDADGMVAAVQSEVDRIVKDGVPSEEMERAKVQFRAAAVSALAGTLERTIGLGVYAAVDGDPSRLTSDLPRFLSVTSAEIQKAAAKYLVPSNRVVVEIRPSPEAAASPAAGGKKSDAMDTGTRKEGNRR